MAEITTRKGHIIIVDDDDLPLLSGKLWHIGNRGYAQRNEPRGDGTYRTVLMHRVLLGMESDDSREVDHINGVRHDNRRSNLRICLPEENAKNKRRYRNNASGIKGVHKLDGYDRWRARIRVDGKLVHLGYFRNPDDAAKAYREAAVALHGAFANFGGSKDDRATDA